MPLQRLQDMYLLWAQRSFSGSRGELARVLGMSERTLYRQLSAAQERCGADRAGGGNDEEARHAESV